jgi:hypothetical protein
MGSQWYYRRGGQRYGPVSDGELRQLVTTGKLQPTDLIWRAGLKTWEPASKIKGLFPQRSSSPSPQPISSAKSSKPSERQTNPPPSASSTHLTAAPRVVVTATKSVGISIILTLLFGPVGMFYSTVLGGVIMLGVNAFVLVLAICTAGIGGLLFLITWPICVFWGAMAANSYNKKLLRGLR